MKVININEQWCNHIGELHMYINQFYTQLHLIPLPSGHNPSDDRPTWKCAMSWALSCSSPPSPSPPKDISESDTSYLDSIQARDCEGILVSKDKIVTST